LKKQWIILCAVVVVAAVIVGVLLGQNAGLQKKVGELTAQVTELEGKLKDAEVAAEEAAAAAEEAAAAAEEAARLASIVPISICIGSQPETLDPQMNSASDGSDYIQHLFEGLMRRAWDGSGIVAGVAESHEVSDDGMTWTFKIREDAKWSDGQDLTAEDFVYAWQRLVDPAVAAPYAEDMGMFILNGSAICDGKMEPSELGATALDSKTLEVKLQEACPFFTDVMAFPAFYPVRKDIIEANGDGWFTTPATLIGTGAYKLDSWTMDEEIVMAPNENHYEVDKLVAQKLVFKLISDPVAKLAAVRAGEIDFSDDIPSEEREATIAEGLYTEEAVLGTYYVDLNNTMPPFDNVLVRKAFALAIDPVYLSANAANHIYMPATNFVGPGFIDADGSPFVDKKVIFDRSDYEANKEAAKAALAEAGYPDGEGFPAVEYTTNPSGVHIATAEALQAMWKEVLNVNVEVNQMEWGVFLPFRRDHQHTLARNGWVADFNDPSNLLQLMYSKSGNNSTGYNNPAYDELMNKAASESDPAVRMELMHEAEVLAFATDYSAIPVYYYTQYYVANPVLKDFALYATNDKLFHLATK